VVELELIKIRMELRVEDAGLVDAVLPQGEVSWLDNWEGVWVSKRRDELNGAASGEGRKGRREKGREWNIIKGKYRRETQHTVCATDKTLVAAQCHSPGVNIMPFRRQPPKIYP
jgi:hypothetical protein